MLACAGNDHISHAEDNMIRSLPDNNSGKIIDIFVVIIRVTRSGLIARSRPCGRTCGGLTGCKKILAVDALSKGYRVSHVIYSDIDDNYNRFFVKESCFDLINTPDLYESRGNKIRTGQITCKIS